MTDKKVIIAGIKTQVTASSVNELALAKEVIAKKTRQLDDDAFYVLNVDVVIDHVAWWRQQLPQIKPFYAVKSNPHPIMIKLLAALGVNFDCASKGELRQVLAANVDPARIIFANPAKPVSYIQFAKQAGVRKMTLDSVEELEKIEAHFPEAELVLRLAFADATAMSPLSAKFGADCQTTAPEIVRRIAAKCLNLAGISFHVGSGVRDPTSFARALQTTKPIIELARSLGLNPRLIDVGGGFPGGQLNANFEDCARELRTSIRELFHDEDFEFIAEPGRFFCAQAFTLFANVIHATRVKSHDSENLKYYINDGVFNSFACVFNDYMNSYAKPVIEKPIEAPKYKSTIWGPTCDGLDKLEIDQILPELSIGEWIYYTDMGAYTLSCASSFNGFSPTQILPFISESAWKEIEPKIDDRT